MTELSATKWSNERASEWYAGKPWQCGFNFLPSTAVNSTEMWQADTFDEETIARELGWAKRIGMKSCRAFLQYLVWEGDPSGLIARFDRFLEIASSLDLSVMPVLFDDCAFSGKQPYLGVQDAPVPGIHNSAWTPSPGIERTDDVSRWPMLQKYVVSMLETFADDDRIVLWDLYNEPGNSERGDASLPLLKAVFKWARSAALTQPITAGLWDDKLGNINAECIEQSDVITFHLYCALDDLVAYVDKLKGLTSGRPVICTEWMARHFDSLFETHLPYYAEQGIWCYNWGLVKGKTQTHFPWGSVEGAGEPEKWFHDIFYTDGKAYSDAEIGALKAANRVGDNS